MLNYNYYFYLWYKVVARLFVIAVVPFVVFSVVNFKIFFEVRKVRRKSASASASAAACQGNLETEIVMTLSILNSKNRFDLTSVTRFDDLLNFGQVFKAFGNNYFAQISHILWQFLEMC